MVAIFDWRRPHHLLFAAAIGIWSGYYIWEPPLRVGGVGFFTFAADSISQTLAAHLPCANGTWQDSELARFIEL